MPKLEKQKLERLTENAVRLAGLAMSMLVVTRCPVRQEYERLESFLHDVDEVRESLGLPPVSDAERIYGKPEVRRPIGFALPERVEA